MAGNSKIDEQTWCKLLLDRLQGATIADLAKRADLSESWVREHLKARTAAIRAMLEAGDARALTVDRLVLAKAALDADQLDLARKTAQSADAVVRALRGVLQAQALMTGQAGTEEAGRRDEEIEDDIADPHAELRRRIARSAAPNAADARRDRGDGAGRGAGRLL